jgi:hypothetical protein
LTWTNYAELKHIYTAIFRVNTGWANSHRCKLVSLRDFRTVAGTPVAATNPTAHSSLTGLELAGPGVTYGHINDQPQTIAGEKTLTNGLLTPTLEGTSTAGVAITGRTDGNSPAVGKVEETISATVSRASAVACTSNQWRDVTSISLTAGYWDLSATGCAVGNSTAAIIEFGVGTTTGNSGVGVVDGDGTLYGQFNLNAVDMHGSCTSRPISISATTTFYLKIYYSGTGTCSGYGTIRAVRRS